MSLEALNSFSKIIWMMITIIDIPNALKSNRPKHEKSAYSRVVLS